MDYSADSADALFDTFATGPFTDFTPRTIDHPSGANFMVAQPISYSVNSLTWRGDPTS